MSLFGSFLRKVPTLQKSGTEQTQRNKVAGMVADGVLRRMAQVPDELKGRDRYQYIIRNGFESFVSMLPEFENEINALRDELLRQDFENDESFYGVIVPRASNFLLEHIPLPKFEEAIRRSKEAAGEVILSRILTYEYKGGDTLSIHVPTVFSINNPLELREEMVKGFRKLAEYLRNDESLRGVIRIYARSELIRRGRPLMNRAGFDTSDVRKDLDPDEAEITVETFLRQPYIIDEL